MAAVRAALIAAIVLILAATPLAVPSLSRSLAELGTAAAAPIDGDATLTTRDGPRCDRRRNGELVCRNDNDGDDDDDDDGGGDDDDDDNNRNDNGGDDDDDDNNGNDNDWRPAPASSGRSGGGAPAGCSTPGRETVFTSPDGRVAVRVFSNTSRSLRFSIRMPVDPASVPAVPGRTVDALIFELVAEECGGGAVSSLPAEVNLGIRYTDGDAAGLDESRFKIARLASGQWQAVDKQAADPPANYVSATIQSLGTFVVHQP